MTVNEKTIKIDQFRRSCQYRIILFFMVDGKSSGKYSARFKIRNYYQTVLKKQQGEKNISRIRVFQKNRFKKAVYILNIP